MIVFSFSTFFRGSYVNLFRRYRYNILVIYSRQYNGVKARFTRVTMFISTILNGDSK